MKPGKPAIRPKASRLTLCPPILACTRRQEDGAGARVTVGPKGVLHRAARRAKQT
jgi:hypothetical protein